MSKNKRGRPVKNVIRKIPATSQEIAQTIFGAGVRSEDKKTKPQKRPG